METEEQMDIIQLQMVQIEQKKPRIIFKVIIGQIMFLFKTKLQQKNIMNELHREMNTI